MQPCETGIQCKIYVKNILKKLCRIRNPLKSRILIRNKSFRIHNTTHLLNKIPPQKKYCRKGCKDYKITTLKVPLYYSVSGWRLPVLADVRGGGLEPNLTKALWAWFFFLSSYDDPCECRVANPHHFNADPDPAFHFNADSYPDPAPHLRSLVYWPFMAPFWASRPPLGEATALHGYILCL